MSSDLIQSALAMSAAQGQQSPTLLAIKMAAESEAQVAELVQMAADQSRATAQTQGRAMTVDTSA